MSFVRVPPVLRAEAGGAREVEAAGKNRARAARRPRRRGCPHSARASTATARSASFVNVYVDGEDVRTRDGLDTPVRESSTVILLPAMAGGC